MSDQLRLTGRSNTSIDGHSGYIDIPSKTISNVLNLLGRHHIRRHWKKSNQNIKPTAISNNKHGISDGNVKLEHKLDKNTNDTHSEILDTHFNFETLVNFPEMRRRQIEKVIMDKSEIQTKPQVLPPDFIRDLHSKSNDVKNKTINTTENVTNKNSKNDDSKTFTSSTPETSTVVYSVSSTTTTSVHHNGTKTSVDEKGVNKVLSTKLFTKPVTVPFSSEESSSVTTESPKENDHDDSNFDEVTVTYTNKNETLSGRETMKDKNNSLQNEREHGQTGEPQRHGRPGGNNNVDIIIFPSKRSDADKRRKERQGFCTGINFGTANIGYQCCFRTLSCFDNLPEILDETVFHQGESNYDASQRLLLCHDIDDSLLCMGRVLDRPNCRRVANIINENIQPEMKALKLFYQNTCSRGPTIPEIIPIPNTTTRPNKHNRLGNTGVGPLSSPIIPFIGGAFAGLFVLAMVMLLIVYCRRRCKRSARNEAGLNGKNPGDKKSMRYKKDRRRKSSVYEEIDIDKMIPVPTASGSRKTSSESFTKGSRKTPSAPNASKGRVENHYYLSPTSSLPEEKQITENEKGVTNFGYLELHTDENGQSYAKLKSEGDYITPNEIASSPPPPKVQKVVESEYHTYFVLEKENENDESEAVEK